ncbi:aldo/keto reductase [Tessaracoccus antarcticus]|nr:aldo/keto reductase [Tessaracoccus antarcticus]
MRRIGRFNVSPIGMGATPLSSVKSTPPSREMAVATVHAALDSGITLIDTADIHGPTWEAMGENESIVAEALRTYGRDTTGVVVATKGGVTRGPGERMGRDGSAGYLRHAAEQSMVRLGVERLDVYYWHRPDRSRPYAEGVEALAQMQADGLIAEIGISNVNVEEIQVAIDVLGEGGLAAVQNQLSPRFNHTSKPELDFCGEHGIAFVAFSPLGGIRGNGAYVVRQRPVITEVVGRHHGISPQRVILAWELALGNHVIPIPGASRPATIIDSARAMTLTLDPEDLRILNEELL